MFFLSDALCRQLIGGKAVQGKGAGAGDRSGGENRASLQHWKRIMNAGYAGSCWTERGQQEIILLQQQIGFEYIRIKGILDDDMVPARTDMIGNRVKNFTYVDEAIDFLLCQQGRSPWWD